MVNYAEFMEKKKQQFGDASVIFLVRYYLYNKLCIAALL